MTSLMYGSISSRIAVRNASSSLDFALGHELDSAIGKVANVARNIETPSQRLARECGNPPPEPGPRNGLGDDPEACELRPRLGTQPIRYAADSLVKTGSRSRQRPSNSNAVRSQTVTTFQYHPSGRRQGRGKSSAAARRVRSKRSPRTSRRASARQDDRRRRRFDLRTARTIARIAIQRSSWLDRA